MDIHKNLYHLVLHVDVEQAKKWSDYDVIEHWGALFNNPLALKVSEYETLTSAEKEAINLQVEGWRERLTDISWFMRCLNEFIARQSNQEDDSPCKLMRICNINHL